MALAACSDGADPPPPTLSPQMAAGKRVFVVHCGACHSPTAETVIVGPSLAGIAAQGATRVDGLDDRAKIDELWSPVYKIYFPKGKDDPALRLIKVSVDKAEYRDSKGMIPTVIAFAQAMMGRESELADNEKIALN